MKLTLESIEVPFFRRLDEHLIRSSPPKNRLNTPLKTAASGICYSTDIVDGVRNIVKKPSRPIGPIHTGKDAAKAAIQLMDRTAKAVPPKLLIDVYISAGEKSTVAVQDALWGRFGDETIKCMADGAQVLAVIWEAAWSKRRGGRVMTGDLGRGEAKRLINLYEDRTFVPSLNLDSISKKLRQ